MWLVTLCFAAVFTAVVFVLFGLLSHVSIGT